MAQEQVKPESRDTHSMGRPLERTGSYRRITLELPEAMLETIHASGKTYRAYIEEAVNEFSRVSAKP